MTALIRRLGAVRRKTFTLDTLTTDRQSWERLSAYGGGRWTRFDGNEGLDHDFDTYVEHAYCENGIIFACILARQLVFSEARFQYRRRIVGRPGDYFGNGRLGILEKPWVNGTTGDLLTRMESDASLAGNFYATTVDDFGNIGNTARGGPGERLVRMRPDWITIMVGVPGDDRPRPNALGARVLAYIYSPPAWTPSSWFSSPGDLDETVTLLPDEVVHYAPTPHPSSGVANVGISWLTPVLKEIESDLAATVHKRRFFKAGASPSMAVSFDKDTSSEEFAEFRENFNEQHGGADSAYRPLFLVGADVRPLTFDLKQLDLKAVQGHIETRIAAAARVPPIIAGLSEGLASSTYSNYAQARRHFADMTMRPLWRKAAGSLQPLVDLGDGSELWYDDRDVAFLREDLTAAAEIQAREASTITALIAAGFEPDSVIRAVRSQDFALLKHTGLLSVQLQEPGQPAPGAPASNGTTPPPNGSGNGSVNGAAAGQALAALNGRSGND